MAKAIPDLELHFPGQNVRPESISIRLLADAIAAVMQLAADGREEESDLATIRLLAVKRGSATFQCVAPNAADLLKRLNLAGRLLRKPDVSDDLGAVIKPLRILSRIAASVGCPIVIRQFDGNHICAQIDADTYDVVSGSLLVHGHKTIAGNVQRVGGATERRCALRVDFQEHLLFCTVANERLARQLGQFLYQEVVVSGQATQLRQSWRIVDFRIDDVAPRGAGPLGDAFRALRDAGGDAWDRVGDPESYLEEYTGR